MDVLDPNDENIARLRDFGLYRNYINRKISGLNSTGLREDIYDAVVMVGGFEPSGINELLRITKPGD